MYLYFFYFTKSESFLRSPFVSCRERKRCYVNRILFSWLHSTFLGTPLLPDDSRTLSDELVETSINHRNAATLRDEIARVSRHQLRNRPWHVAFTRKVRPLKLNGVLRVPFIFFFLQLYPRMLKVSHRKQTPRRLTISLSQKWSIRKH